MKHESILVRDEKGKLWQPNERHFNTHDCWKESEIIARGDYFDLNKIKEFVNNQRELEGEVDDW